MKQVLLLLVLYFVICVFGERQEKDFYEPEPLGSQKPKPPCAGTGCGKPPWQLPPSPPCKTCHPKPPCASLPCLPPPFPPMPPFPPKPPCHSCSHPPPNGQPTTGPPPASQPNITTPTPPPEPPASTLTRSTTTTGTLPPTIPSTTEPATTRTLPPTATSTTATTQPPTTPTQPPTTTSSATTTLPPTTDTLPATATLPATTSTLTPTTPSPPTTTSTTTTSRPLTSDTTPPTTLSPSTTRTLPPTTTSSSPPETTTRRPQNPPPPPVITPCPPSTVRPPKPPSPPTLRPPGPKPPCHTCLHPPPKPPPCSTCGGKPPGRPVFPGYPGTLVSQACLGSRAYQPLQARMANQDSRGCERRKDCLGYRTWAAVGSAERRKDLMVRLSLPSLKVHPHLRALLKMKRTPATSDARIAVVDIIRTFRRVLQCLHRGLHRTGTEIRGAGQDGLAHPAGLAGPDLPVCLQLLVFPAFLACLLSQGSRESLGFLGNMEYPDSLGRLAVVAGSAKVCMVVMVRLAPAGNNQVRLDLPVDCIATPTRIRETSATRLRQLVRPDIATTTSGAAAMAFRPAPAGGHGQDGGRRPALPEDLDGPAHQDGLEDLAGLGRSVHRDTLAGPAILRCLGYPDSLQSLDFLESQGSPVYRRYLVSLVCPEFRDSLHIRPFRAHLLHPCRRGLHLRHRRLLQRHPVLYLRHQPAPHSLLALPIHESNSLSGWDAFNRACEQDADRGGATGSGSLVSIHTSGEQNFAHSLASRLSGPLDHTGGVSVWIGGRKTDRFRWSSKIDSQEIDYTRWEPANPAIGFYPGMPDNNIYRNTTQNCVRMQVRRPAHSGLLALNGEWDDIECYNALFKAGICQARPLCIPPSGRR